MNSRAAYDEDEVLRKVLEESKHEGALPTSDGTNRKKRSREESGELDPRHGGAPPSEGGNRKKRSREEGETDPGHIEQVKLRTWADYTEVEAKRQRTGSRSPSNSPVLESDDESSKTVAPKQKPRGAAARSQREKELRDKERERAEAANRRKGRAERRKGEGADMDSCLEVGSDMVADPEIPEATPTDEQVPAITTESAPPEIPTVEHKPTTAPRKGGRPPQKRQGRQGRHQNPKDTSATTNGASPAADDIPNSPQVSSTNGVGNGHDSSDGAAGARPTKAKNWRLQKLSWHDIRRPAGVMQSYISQRQVEMAGEKSAAPTPPSTLAATNGAQSPDEAKGDEEDLEKFKKLSTLQMMDYLSRDLTHWQRMVSEQNEK